MDQAAQEDYLRARFTLAHEEYNRLGGPLGDMDCPDRRAARDRMLKLEEDMAARNPVHARRL